MNKETLSPSGCQACSRFSDCQNLSLSDQVRKIVRNQIAVERRGMQHRLSQKTGISEPMLSRFLKGKNGLSMKYLDALARALSIRVSV